MIKIKDCDNCIDMNKYNEYCHIDTDKRCKYFYKEDKRECYNGYRLS